MSVCKIRPSIVLLTIVCFSLLIAATSATADDDAKIDFNRDVKPILAKNCFACHGPDGKAREAELRLDTRLGATAKHENRQAILAGQRGKSELFRRIMSKDTDELMPPPDSGHRLTNAQKQLLGRWIDSGAEYALHWSFERPQRPALPSTSNPSWTRNAIDTFVLSRLDSARLKPSPEADRYQLVRRVSLDLLGVPPSREEAERFVSDESPDAYEQLVNRVLASPRYGERWAAVWLDLARYADTQGYEKDAERVIWSYRDWVVRALNDGMTYDDFTIRQIAGDLLPNATLQNQVATGFHRNTMTNTEGGTDDEEFRSLAVKDRITTTMQVWMGLTFGCAQCHSHKFDPISNEEYYRFYAFFNQTADADRGDDQPKIKFDGVTTLVMRDLPKNKRRTTRIHLRGNFLAPGKEVQPGIPESLHRLPDGVPMNRLSVARWLVDEKNPLTARVAVNRIWARLFGIGIVETEEDFGSQGLPPSHPKLLDWLATELVRTGWDTKALIRTIVTSATYRQSSNVTPEGSKRDKYNRLLARGSRFRIDAEVVRDQALAVSGLLSDRMFGPPVMPPQPDGVWQVVYSGRRWVTSQGVNRHRRAFYTYRRRTSPYPSMLTFDAGSGEVCLLRRIRTNSPLQALVTLNDPVYVEAAAGLAGRVETEATNQSLNEKLEFAFRTCLVRPPSRQELQSLSSAYRKIQANWKNEPRQAAEFVAGVTGAKATPNTDKSPDNITRQATWIVICNVLLNLDETLTRR